MKKKITIAIDGWSSCGKSTLAKALAKELSYIYVDTGAMYRGVALYGIENGMIQGDTIEEDKIVDALSAISISFSYAEPGKADLLLNDENVEQKIRTLQVSNVVSLVAKISAVRKHLVAEQRRMGQDGGVVMDGRDVGSVVFPNAELKIFLTADPEIRAKRRYDELRAKGENPSLEEVAANLKLRDEIDATRKDSPLIQTDDAIVVDNTNLTQEEQLVEVLKIVERITQ